MGSYTADRPIQMLGAAGLVAVLGCVALVQINSHHVAQQTSAVTAAARSQAAADKAHRAALLLAEADITGLRPPAGFTPVPQADSCVAGATTVCLRTDLDPAAAAVVARQLVGAAPGSGRLLGGATGPVLIQGYLGTSQVAVFVRPHLVVVNGVATYHGSTVNIGYSFPAS
jgi:hypothetical protein